MNPRNPENGEKMFLQLEKGESIDKNEIIGIFDLDGASLAKSTRDWFREKEEERAVVNVSNDLPKSMLLCDGEFSDRVYLTGISTESIKKRLETAMKVLWKR